MRRGTNATRGRTDEQFQPYLKKRTPNQDITSAPEANYERGGSSQGVKSSCSTCGKKHYGK